jgi:DNA-binding transcriptional ArsR family regulator
MKPAGPSSSRTSNAMSSARPREREIERRAVVFAALGDETRLSLVGKLSKGTPQSISKLARGSPLTRQAITKHLRVLEGARLVGSVRVGRESLFELRPEPLKEIQSYLERVSEQWDHALARLKSFVEE